MKSDHQMLQHFTPSHPFIHFSFWLGSNKKMEKNVDTPLKLNSPLKSYRNPIGKDRLPTTIFQGRAVKLQEGNFPKSHVFGQKNPIGFLRLFQRLSFRFRQACCREGNPRLEKIGRISPKKWSKIQENSNIPWRIIPVSGWLITTVNK